MKLRTNTAKITMTLFITLALTFLMIGCGNVKPDATTEDTELGEATEATVAETEMEEAAENTEPTEVATEVVDTEDVLAIGYSTINELMVLDQPSVMEYTFITDIYEGDTVYILGKYYNEYDQVDFYKIRLETGEVGYVEKQYIRLAE